MRLPLIDHRGRSAALCHSRMLPSGADDETRSRVRSANKPIFVGLRAAAVLFFVFMGAHLLFQLVWAQVNWQSLGQSALLMLGVSVLVMVSFVARTRQTALSACLHRGLCPTCAHDLLAIVPEDDGCTVCPSCGGAWLVHARPPLLPSSACGRCGYDLGGLPASPDRSRICPECGAAWRLRL